MKIHSETKYENELETILDENKIPYKKFVDKVNKKYKTYYTPKLPEYTFDEKYISNHVIYEISKKEWKQEYFSLFGKIPSKLNYIHYKDFSSVKGKNIDCCIDTTIKKPNFPIYVISYQRHEKFYTIKYLEEMELNYFLCIKEKEVLSYVTRLETLGYKYYELLVMNEEYEKKENNIGNYASIPQRNKCWEHSVTNGHKSHWILDDNIDGFYIYNKQCKVSYNHFSFFTYMEIFRENVIESVGLVSPNYKWDFPDIDYRQPFNINRKNYSCILVNTELLDKYRIRWRKTYNEDVRLTLDCLLNGIRTIGFNQFLINKKPTGSVHGGNEEIYKKHSIEGFRDKFNEIKEEFPDLIRSIKKHKDGRMHHSIKTVCFNSFKKITFHK